MWRLFLSCLLQYDLSPCMLARILLDVFLEQNPRPQLCECQQESTWTVAATVKAVGRKRDVIAREEKGVLLSWGGKDGYCRHVFSASFSSPASFTLIWLMVDSALKNLFSFLLLLFILRQPCAADGMLKSSYSHLLLCFSAMLTCTITVSLSVCSSGPSPLSVSGWPLPPFPHPSFQVYCQLLLGSVIFPDSNIDLFWLVVLTFVPTLLSQPWLWKNYTRGDGWFCVMLHQTTLLLEWHWRRMHEKQNR